MKRTIVVEVDDETWPMMNCVITSKASHAEIRRQSLYDTAFTNFEVHVTNTLRAAVGIIIRERQNHGTSGQTGEDREDNGRVQTRYAAEWVEERAKSKVPKAGRGHRPQPSSQKKVKEHHARQENDQKEKGPGARGRAGNLSAVSGQHPKNGHGPQRTPPQLSRSRRSS